MKNETYIAGLVVGSQVYDETVCCAGSGGSSLLRKERERLPQSAFSFFLRVLNAKRGRRGAASY